MFCGFLGHAPGLCSFNLHPRLLLSQVWVNQVSHKWDEAPQLQQGLKNVSLCESGTLPVEGVQGLNDSCTLSSTS